MMTMTGETVSRRIAFEIAIREAAMGWPKGNTTMLVELIRQGAPRDDYDRQLLADLLAGKLRRGRGNPGNSQLQFAAKQVERLVRSGKARGFREYGLQTDAIKTVAENMEKSGLFPRVTHDRLLNYIGRGETKPK